MKFVNMDVVNFISFWFKKATYVEVYNSIIYLVNGEQVWEKTEMPNVLPPPTKKMFERLKNKRRLEAWEVMKNKTQLVYRKRDPLGSTAGQEGVSLSSIASGVARPRASL